MDRRHVIEIVARHQRTAAHRVAERVSVRAVDADGDGGPQHRQQKTERDHRLHAEVERVEDEEKHARGADRDWDSDALDDRLHREPLVGPDHLVRGVDRCARRSVGRREVGDAQDARQGEHPERRCAGSGSDESHDPEHSGHDCGVEGQPEA